MNSGLLEEKKIKLITSSLTKWKPNCFVLISFIVYYASHKHTYMGIKPNDKLPFNVQKEVLDLGFFSCLKVVLRQHAENWY